MRIIDFFDQGVRYYTDKVAIVDNNSRYTYAEADRQVHRIAAAIHGNGFRQREPASVCIRPIQTLPGWHYWP